tara:strand:+ start:437 stop:604 length:168 start_codon:yes stop_codon:yes gene_type:complete
VLLVQQEPKVKKVKLEQLVRTVQKEIQVLLVLLEQLEFKERKVILVPKEYKVSKV